MKCSACGHNNVDDANYCSSCGSSLRKSDLVNTITLAPVEAEVQLEHELELDIDRKSLTTSALVVKRGFNPGTTFLLEKSLVTIGRHPESDIVLDDITVSRRHAEISQAGTNYILKDVGSLNGTYVNRERVDEKELRSGDELQIGKFKLVFLGGNA